MLIWFGYALLVAGVGLSLATLVHDLRRHRLYKLVPQAAPSRIMPEVHMLGALLSGIGAWLAWDWLSGIEALAGQVVLAYFVIRPIFVRD